MTAILSLQQLQAVEGDVPAEEKNSGVSIACTGHSSVSYNC